MAAILNVWRHEKIWLRQSMHVYLKNIPAKFHRDPIWNDGVLEAFMKKKNNNNKMSGDIWDQFLI